MNNQQQFFVYMLRCADNTFYIGSTNNLEKRLHQHNALKSGARYTKTRRPVTMVYSEKHLTLTEARRREIALKKKPRKVKEALLSDI